MAAALTLLLRDTGAPMPVYQVIAYPLLDLPEGWPSYIEHGSGYVLDSDQITWFFGHFLPPGWDRKDPYLFPLAERDLTGLPPALVMTAEFDPLRDGGVAYAERLANCGVSVEHLHAEDQMHGFLLLGRAVANASRLVDRVADGLLACRR
jgi:acetyl esterase